MSVTKYRGGEGARALATAATPGASAEPVAAEPQTRVLSEISHELGNFFHKLYYWADYLRENPVSDGADSTATEMLEGTIRNLEGFLRFSLDYFRPLRLSVMPMAVADLVDGVVHQARAHLGETPLAIGRPSQRPTGAVAVDPGLLSRALEIAMRHLARQLGPASRVEVVAEPHARRDGPGLEVTFRLHEPAEGSPLFRTAEAGVEWAIAEKIVALHGGELGEEVPSAGEKRMVVFLPCIHDGLEQVRD